MSFTDPSARAADAAVGRGEAVARADSRAVFGQVMGLVAVTVAFTAAGAYIGRDLTGGIGIAFFVGAIVCVIGLNVAAKRSESLAIVEPSTSSCFQKMRRTSTGAAPVVAP